MSVCSVGHSLGDKKFLEGKFFFNFLFWNAKNQRKSTLYITLPNIQTFNAIEFERFLHCVTLNGKLFYNYEPTYDYEATLDALILVIIKLNQILDILYTKTECFYLLGKIT